jgi:hypothetical protein
MKTTRERGREAGLAVIVVAIVRTFVVSPKIKLSRRFRNVFASLPTVRTPFAALRRHHIMSSATCSEGALGG